MMFSTALAQINKIQSVKEDLGAPAQLSELDDVFGNVVFVILALAGIVLFVTFIMGGIKFITAGSDPKAAESAKKTITSAILGMVLLAAAYLILTLIGYITGIDLSNFTIYNTN